VILATDTFLQIADPTDAPVPVEITWTAPAVAPAPAPAPRSPRPRSPRDPLPPAHPRPARRRRARAPPRPRPELRGRSQHGAPHRCARPGRPGRPRGRDRCRARIAHPRARRDRRPCHRGRGRPRHRPGAAIGRRRPSRRRRRRGRRHHPRLGRAARRSAGRLDLVANLPYNVATPLVCDLLDEVPRSARCWSWCSARWPSGSPPAGSKQYGAVSVKVAYWATAKVVATVPASVFVPAPQRRVGARADRSARTPGSTAPGPLFDAGSHGVRPAPQDAAPLARRGRRRPQFESAGVSPESRPEQLDLDAWCRLTDAVAGVRGVPSSTAVEVIAPPSSR
jgi:hypothetical protein